MYKFNPAKIKEAILAIFYVSLLFGFLIFGTYFINIRYFPVVNLQTILYLPLIAAFVGFLISFSTPLLVVGAPLLWSEFLKNEKTCQLVVGNDESTNVIDMYKNGFIDLTKKARSRIFLNYTWSLTLGISLWLLTTLIDNKYNTEYPRIFLLFLGFLSYLWIFSNTKKNTNNIYSKYRRRFYHFCTLASGTIFPSLILYMSSLGLCVLLNAANLTDFLSVIIFLIFGSTICLLPLSKEWNLVHWSSLVAISTICVLFIFQGSLNDLTTQIIHIFKLGDIKHAMLTTDRVGCEIIKNTPCNKKQNRFFINDITILWRAGEYYVQDENKPTVTFIIPARHIKGITVKTVKEA